MNITVNPAAGHAVYAPSSAHRWVHCTASAEAIAMLGEQEEGEEAAEGTRAHDEIERVLGPWTETNGAAALHHDVDSAHPAAYGVALVVAYCRQLPPGRLWVEQRVHLTDQIWGRCDVAHWAPATATLTIIDYKNGMRAVDAEENPQLRIYAAASMFTHRLPVKWVRYVVVQPNDWRSFVPRVKQWIEPVDALYAWAETVAAIPNLLPWVPGEGQNASGPPLKKFTAGSHCRDCPLFGKCDASLDMLSNFGAVMFGLASPESVPLAQRALLLACKKPIEDTIKSAEKVWNKQALSSMTAPPGMKIVEGKTNRAWIDEDVARDAVMAKLGVSALKPPTPAQAEEMGLDVSDLATEPEGVPVLAFENDKRKTWARKTGADMFGDLVKVARQ